MSFTRIKPATLLAPTPVVMVSCADEHRAPNIVTVAWAGTVNSDPPMVSISIRPERHSHDIIQNSGEFVINLVSRPLLWATDYCGVKSGRNEDKFSACKLHPLRLDSLQFAPAIEEAPVYIACRVERSLLLGSHTLFIANVVDIGIQSELMDEKGKINLHKADLIAYRHGEYAPLSASEGFFGFSVARPDILEKRMKELKD